MTSKEVTRHSRTKKNNDPSLGSYSVVQVGKRGQIQESLQEYRLPDTRDNYEKT